MHTSHTAAILGGITNHKQCLHANKVSWILKFTMWVKLLNELYFDTNTTAMQQSLSSIGKGYCVTGQSTHLSLAACSRSRHPARLYHAMDAPLANGKEGQVRNEASMGGTNSAFSSPETSFLLSLCQRQSSSRRGRWDQVAWEWTEPSTHAV